MDEIVSIVLPTYNRASTICRAIDSVLKQSYMKFELIIIDDCSIDDTYKLIQQYSDKRIQYYKLEQNRGANYARNIGIGKAKGKYIAFIDSDNEWDERKLEIQIDEMLEVDDSVGIIYSAFLRIDKNRRTYIPNKTVDEKYKEDKIIEYLILNNLIDTNTVLVRKECFEKVGVFDEKLSRLQDWEMFFRIISIGEYRVKYIDRILDYNYVQYDSLSNSNINYLKARLAFLEKYLSFVNKAEKAAEFVRDVINIDCDEFPIVCRVQILKSILGENSEAIMDGLILANETNKKKRKKFEDYYNLLNDWLDAKQENRDINQFLYQNNYKSVAIYGMGNIGKRLINEIDSENILIKYIIDKKYRDRQSIIPIVQITEKLEETDVIIVTIVNEFDKIVEELKRYNKDIDIISLNEIVG